MFQPISSRFYHHLYLISSDAAKKKTSEGEIVQGDSLSKDARSEVLSGVLSQIERSYGKGMGARLNICEDNIILIKSRM